MTDQSYQYGEPAAATVAGSPAIPAPAQAPAPLTVEAPAQAPAVADATVPGAAVVDSPAAAPAGPVEAAPAFVPAPGTFARYTSHDPYANPARDRTQLVYVVSHVDDGNGGVTVLGVPLCFLDDVAGFAPGMLSQG